MFERENRLFHWILDEIRTRNGNETAIFELKENNINPDQIGKTISAISNACVLEKKETGYIIFGVENETLNILGTTFDPFNLKAGSSNQDMEMYLRTVTMGVDFKFIPFRDGSGNQFLIIEVFKSLGRPSTYSGIAYIRIGKNTSPLKSYPDLERRIWSAFEPNYFWKKSALSVPKTKEEILELLDYQNYYLLMDLPMPDDQEEVINRFIEENFILEQQGELFITNLGALLFARDMSKFENLKYKTPRVITYDGDTKLSTVIKDLNGEKGYANGFEGLINWINSQIPEPEIITGVFREQKINYPPESLRELIANSLIHQDCELDGMRSIIEIYKNHIDITSPGTCLVDLERIIDAVPKARNEYVVDIMRRLKICEVRGSGIDRTIQKIEEKQLPAPRFVNQEEAFVSTMYTYKPYENLDTEERLRACVQHVALMYLSGKYANNESLRNRFGIPEGKSYLISKLVSLAKDNSLIKDFDAKSSSKRYTRYVPIWV